MSTGTLKAKTVNGVLKVDIPSKWEEAFDDSLLEENYAGFTYVNVNEYRKRLFEVTGIMFNLMIKDKEIFKQKKKDKQGDLVDVLTFMVHVHLGVWVEIPDGSLRYVYKEHLSVNSSDGKKDDDYTLAAAVSDAFKRCMLYFGNGTDLYEKELQNNGSGRSNGNGKAPFHIPDDMKGKSKFYSFTGKPKEKQLNWASDLLAKSKSDVRKQVAEKLKLDVELNPEASDQNELKDKIKEYISKLQLGQISMIIDLLNKR